jgi:hypothetical protein
MMNNTNVLLLIFNRPSTTAIVFEAIKKCRPAKLFIGADGPREGRNEEERCREARSIATQVDWPCEVYTLFRETNMGSGRAVSEAISWFFDHVEQGIILEDDCLPDQSFFKFCDVLLDKYAGTKEVMAISGTNLLRKGWRSGKQSYHFGHGGVWGWATWKRAWDLYDFNMPDWQHKKNRDKIKTAMGSDNWFNYFLAMFNGAYNKELDAWDLQWFHCILNNGALAIHPSLNLVKNIGFGPLATNTGDLSSPYAQLTLGQMEFPLKHPVKIRLDKKYLRVTFRYIFGYNRSFASTTKAWIMLYLNRIKKRFR